MAHAHACNKIASADGSAEIDNEQVQEREPIEEETDEKQQGPNTNRGPRSRVTQAEFYSLLMSIRGYFNNVVFNKKCLIITARLTRFQFLF